MSETKTFYADQVACLIGDEARFNDLYVEAEMNRWYIEHCWQTHQDRFKPIQMDTYYGGSRYVKEGSYLIVHDTSDDSYWRLSVTQADRSPHQSGLKLVIEDVLAERVHRIKGEVSSRYLTQTEMQSYAGNPASRWMA